jgi:flagellar biosynthesis/type III secretory pathway M-ring protein FliF/YscJ
MTMELTNLIPLAVSLIGAGTAAVSTIYTLRSERRRKEGQAEEAAHTAAASRQQLENEITERVLTRANRDMEQMSARIKAQDDRIAAQDEKIARLVAENHALRVWASMLCQQLGQLGHEPLKMPEIV